MIDASKLYYNRYGKNSDLDLSQVDISPLLKSILSRASVRKFSKKPVNMINVSKSIVLKKSQ